MATTKKCNCPLKRKPLVSKNTKSIVPKSIMFSERRTYVCPKCGKKGTYMPTAETYYIKGASLSKQTCLAIDAKKDCDGVIHVKTPDKDILWASLNGKWAVSLEAEAEGKWGHYFTCAIMDQNINWGYVIREISEDGRIRQGKNKQETPKYVIDQCDKILRDLMAKYLKKKGKG